MCQKLKDNYIDCRWLKCHIIIIIFYPHWIWSSNRRYSNQSDGVRYWCYSCFFFHQTGEYWQLTQLLRTFSRCSYYSLIYQYLPHSLPYCWKHDLLINSLLSSITVYRRAHSFIFQCLLYIFQDNNSLLNVVSESIMRVAAFHVHNY